MKLTVVLSEEHEEKKVSVQKIIHWNSGFETILKIERIKFSNKYICIDYIKIIFIDEWILKEKAEK